MELWFWAAVIAAVLAGVSNFFFKIAAKKGYSSELFMLFSGLFSILYVSTALVLFPEQLLTNKLLALFVFGFGFLAAIAGVMKIYALRYIDSTIYFPLFKLLAPAIAIAAGVTLFGEKFNTIEWVGMLIGLLVPLMLITKSENGRQNNLLLGLLFVLITGVLSAVVAIMNNYAVDSGMPIFVTLLFTVLGIFCGSLSLFCYKQGITGIIQTVAEHFNYTLLLITALRSLLIAISVGLSFYAYTVGGTLAVVQTIHSMYILIPIVLAIIFYNEHWNWQKALAIMLSVVSLAFLG
jgi:drug/metabolite transporter (DMT)-like permease